MKVLLLAGGDSSEREVSLGSGKAVFEALTRLEHTVWAIDPATGKSLLAGDGSFPEVESSSSSGIDIPTPVGARALARTIDSPGFRDVDLVFIALHGGSGENGSVQNLLSLAGKKYTGSSMTASAVAMDKALSKLLLKAIDVDTPKWETWLSTDGSVTEDDIKRIFERMKFPLIVKPNEAGSTVGLSKVDDLTKLEKGLLHAAEYSPCVLVEEFIAGRELTVAVLDGRSLPVVEIQPHEGLYDYHAKYSAGGSKYIVPADIDPTVAAKVQDEAARVYRAIGAAGLARVDFILSDAGRLCCLELNTLPGMTALSLAPMAAEADGISFDSLVTRVLESGLKRRA